ncbi:hypothetical protein [Microbacterium testaceum]|uniref:hypothetical protein n=1 Tax=Microbacterium testaceum TaxID=2033 RepID=UPI0025AF6F7A|nr:hypothetical protein [Microbacterium testaceum]WJS89746.1 hypothetical protein NYQ11_10380 [Microbacterium testaceum]
MSADASYHRAQRLSAIARWAEAGVLEERARLPIEKAFDDRVEKTGGQFFKPIAVADLDDVVFHREISYLIDALDALPKRVDQAFDSAWKAFELETASFTGRRITDRLETASLRLDVAVVAAICAAVPAQTCEYAYKRLVEDFIDERAEEGLKSRARVRSTPQLDQLFNYLKQAYGGSSLQGARRKGAMLLRRALRGETLTLGDVEGFRLDGESLSRFLVLLLLYTARNERFHGTSFSPFVSSDATISTYSHPFFLFLASYYLLLTTWMQTRPDATGATRETLIESLDANTQTTLGLFGRHWDQ